ncbi:hypothetical protein QCA50_020297 [Cerrena zonata]|uniref:Uncharacterized protein n=1 Tax=Cerrena zonata TaxID=2478898 RepID=A0AAW0F9C9_9APHY
MGRSTREEMPSSHCYYPTSWSKHYDSLMMTIAWTSHHEPDFCIPMTRATEAYKVRVSEGSSMLKLSNTSNAENPGLRNTDARVTPSPLMPYSRACPPIFVANMRAHALKEYFKSLYFLYLHLASNTLIPFPVPCVYHQFSHWSSTFQRRRQQCLTDCIFDPTRLNPAERDGQISDPYISFLNPQSSTRNRLQNNHLTL